jgi:hypothetical protein
MKPRCNVQRRLRDYRRSPTTTAGSAGRRGWPVRHRHCRPARTIAAPAQLTKGDPSRCVRPWRQRCSPMMPGLPQPAMHVQQRQIGIVQGVHRLPIRHRGGPMRSRGHRFCGGSVPPGGIMQARNAFTRAVASGSSPCSIVRSARSSFSRFLLVLVTMAGGSPECAGARLGTLSANTGRMEFSPARRVGNRRILVLPTENTIQMSRPDGAWTRCEGPSSGLVTMTIRR